MSATALEKDKRSPFNQTIALNDQVFGPVNLTVRQRINEFKVGFNYRFGPPVVDRAPW